MTRLSCRTSIVALLFRDIGPVMVLLPETLNKLEPSREMGSGRLNSPATSRVAPCKTVVFDKPDAAPSELAVVARSTPCSTTVDPVHVGLLPERISRPGPVFRKLPLPVNVEEIA